MSACTRAETWLRCPTAASLPPSEKEEGKEEILYWGMYRNLHPLNVSGVSGAGGERGLKSSIALHLNKWKPLIVIPEGKLGPAQRF